MKIELNAKLIETVPELKIGINHYTKLTVSESPQMLKGRMHLFQEQLFFELEDKTLNDFPGISAWRDVSNRLGLNTDQIQSSVETFFKRIQQQDYVQPFNSAIDLNNFFSLQYEIPVGLYDLSNIVGDIQFSTGSVEDGYDGVNGRFTSLHNSILSKDDYSPFGSPIIDSIRTAITEETTEALQLFYLRPTMDASEGLALTKACANMFTSINGGDVTSTILHANEPHAFIK